jgi:prepilin-type N-terminal cleavage/methylation domain-containing protein
MTRSTLMRSERGFTIIEMLVATAIMVAITGTIFSLVNPSRGVYRAQPEVSDMQQRLRVGTMFLANDLIMAGAGSPAGSTLMGTLVNFFAPIQPYRLGMIGSDPDAGVFFRSDAITIIYIPANAPQAALSHNMPQPSSELILHAQPNCPIGGDKLCGFEDGQRILIFDESGAYDDMTITQVQDAPRMPNPHLQHNRSVAGNVLSKAYHVGAQVAQVAQRTYHFNAATNQLMYYDGDQRDEAVIDDVVELAFEYFGDPRPPMIINPVTIPKGPWTTYGPKPPALGLQIASWPPGENCAFLVDPASGTHAGRLPDLDPGEQRLVPLTEQMLTDGPWCPDASFPTRYDADLLRVRKIGVRMRVQVAASELRGPAGVLFRNAGTSLGGNRLVPDQEIRFEITPRNFNLGR